MTGHLVQGAYLVAAVLFVLSLAGLSRHETARRGNTLGVTGMALALAATVWLAAERAARPGLTLVLIGLAMAAGAAVGLWRARVVQMTGMPQLVATLHSFVGVAAVLIGYNAYLAPPPAGSGAETATHLVEVFLGVLIGAVTFSGSVVAALKLSARISANPLVLPRRHLLNLLALVASALLLGWFLGTHGVLPLLLMTAVALGLGWHLVASIGGGDMPIVVSMLNSYSGWAAAAAGFLLGNDLLIITGALVGSSGAILSYLMCRGMNRSFLSVIAGGFGSEGVLPEASDVAGEHRQSSPAEVADLLRTARSVVVVPGYGMAVARAQHAVAELTARLRATGTQVRFGIHPVAGRLPGHMNVLLAEARVAYDIVLDLDEANAVLPDADVVLVVGANDTVNPAAVEEPGSPIAGMPVLEVWRAREVVVLKRSMASGYAGVANPLFVRANTRMLFGDAREALAAVTQALGPATDEQQARPGLTR
ncbi:Re/Si-specific NAD(P)(+) transhydrogenase subunit beta [Ornithinimicrobium pekingense]|uniref:NAD(P) transhydrogenase subunit beta n=1 Tax=Ornithinimicrobium pekingense TaxID=384677 RepID=A0ABQ2F9J0_9MICO|nr:Re/Si-specific NAD(P)(+) transhydrogenase subunit beta [Ornithinimicrobium pekingense]GGK74955.1 NAD(P) transhydrogenase subunit beta [Ornithinimicrobium pekingense]